MVDQQCGVSSVMANVEIRARAMTFPDSDLEEKILERVRTSISTECTMAPMETDEPVDEIRITPRVSSGCSSSTDPADHYQELTAFLAQEQYDIEAHFGSLETTMPSIHCSQPLREPYVTLRTPTPSECSGRTDMEDRLEELQAFLLQERLEIEAHFGPSEERCDASIESGEAQMRSLLPPSGQYSDDSAHQALPVLLMPMVMYPSQRPYQQDGSGSVKARSNNFYTTSETSPSSTPSWSTQPSVPVSGTPSWNTQPSFPASGTPSWSTQVSVPETSTGGTHPIAFECEDPQERQAVDGKSASVRPAGPQCNNVQGKTGNSNRRQRRQQKKTSLVVAQYIAARCDACTRPECRVENKRTGTFYQKCHCRVSQCVDDMVEIHYMNGEHADEWLSMNDPRIFSSQDEHWCEHGKVCNHMVRSGKCQKQMAGCDACPGESQRCDACHTHASTFCHLDKCCRSQQKYAGARS